MMTFVICNFVLKLDWHYQIDYSHNVSENALSYNC